MAFFYALYWLFLKRDTFFRINRIFLLLTLLASVLIPYLEIPFKPDANIADSEYAMFDAVVMASQQYLNSNMLEEVVVTTAIKPNTSWYQYLGIIYLMGVLLFTLRFFANLVQLLIWSRKNKRLEVNGVKLVVMNGDYPPFSFLNSVFISKEDYNKPNFKSILEHERVHVDQLHTFDLILLEILTVLFWLNPFIWFYKSSLQEVHEYLADDQVVNGAVNPNEYKMHIVNQFAGGDLFRLANNFGQSTLKKRISMLGKIKTPKIALVKLLLLLPIFTVLFSAFAFTVEEEEKLSNEFSINELIPDELKRFYSFSNEYSGYESESRIHFVKGEESGGISTLEYKNNIDPDRVMVITDEMPVFPGGVNALQNYISSNVNYPKEAAKESIEGRVFVSFVVDRNGEICKTKVVQGVHRSLDKEALRVVAGMPKWQPGKLKGVKVNVSYTIPVNFKIEDYTVEPLASRVPVYKRIKNASDYHLENKLRLKKETEVMLTAEIMPQFQGGSYGLRSYIARKVKYPILAAEQGYEGQVYVRFLVDKDGSVKNAKVVKGANVELNEEALRVINGMPKWMPGEHKGRKIAVSYTIPIRFALN
jgi:TonB family protein